MPLPAAPLQSVFPPPRTGRVSLSEVLSALSHALDLTEGQPPGHILRTCVIGMRLASELGLGEEDRSALYYALLLKDAGCSSNAARMAALFGSSDQAAKYGMKLVDWHRKVPLALRTARTVAPGRPFRDRVRHFVGIARTPDMTRELIQVRCDRGADIALSLGFPRATAEAVRNLDEHWCGKGYPYGRAGEEIPLLARIALLAQTVEIFHAAQGRDAALRMAWARRGTWFDPALVDVVRAWRRDDAWWRTLSQPGIEARAVAAEPGDRAREVDDDALDAVAHAFADIIDAKSPFTFHHSSNVARYARAAAARTGASAAEQRRLYRAGLLHDVGKLGVSSRVLDKAGALDPAERAEIERHPVFSWEILRRVGAFRDFAWTAVLHHEKLDGTGYPWGYSAAQLDTPARLLCAADIYEALTADRPYRAGMPPETALGILRREVAAGRVCGDAVEALAEAAERGFPQPEA